MVKLSEGAVKQIKQVQAVENKPNYALRVSVIGGGCSGMSYKLDFVPEGTERDRTFEQDGVKVVVDPKSILFLEGMELDYSGGLNGKGFVFSNPNAKKSCGCGNSFSA
ncbi:MAG: iron-sulfur cluster assembly accessory protein [Proteobacteria bacterium]|nr:MAG: iron-sulfur cluster assembly accessory protein [Pseudomonadota bacterium]